MRPILSFLELRLGALSLTPGLRLDAYALDGDRAAPRAGSAPDLGFSRAELVLEPRLAAGLELDPALSSSAAAGLYHQAPQPEDLSAVFGTPSLGLARAYHVTLGGALAPASLLSLEVTGFYKAFDALPMRSGMQTALLAHALVEEGTGRTFGVQALLRRELADGFFGWISDTLSRDPPCGPAGLAVPAPVATASTPAGACRLFGSDPPPGNFRPRDPDVSGGYYQPLRVRSAGPDAFALERIRCNLARASADLAAPGSRIRCSISRADLWSMWRRRWPCLGL